MGLEIANAEKGIDAAALLNDFPFKARYRTIDGCSIHYIDEGPPSAVPVLLLHGVPSWSYLFRKIIPGLLLAGYRVIAPDLPGFGRSDKPENSDYYTFDRLTLALSSLVFQLKLDRVVLFGHDWGALLGMRLAVEHQSLLTGLILCNGFVPRGDEKLPLQFRLWKIFTRHSPVLPVGQLISMGCKRRLSKDEMRAYDLPFPTLRSKVAIRILPQLLPFKNSADVECAHLVWEKLTDWHKPLLTLFSNRDAITRGGDQVIHKWVPGARGQHHQLLDGGHFIPEDAPEQITEAIHQFIKGL